MCNLVLPLNPTRKSYPRNRLAKTAPAQHLDGEHVVFGKVVEGMEVVPYTLHPAPYTLHPTPYTLHPTPFTLHPIPYTLHPLPSTLYPSCLEKSSRAWRVHAQSFEE